jgi:hypothetical protein
MDTLPLATISPSTEMLWAVTAGIFKKKIANVKNTSRKTCVNK